MVKSFLTGRKLNMVCVNGKSQRNGSAVFADP
ncbi:hypothetical protein M397_13415 (plasmid) [Staphylococcus aureus S1]|nr:hypothetical protein M397_13415 [Staphylococcus aureus S1]